MKYHHIRIVVLSFFLIVNFCKNTAGQSDEILYKAAFKYLIERYQPNEIVVSDTTATIFFSEFSKEIGGYWGISSKKTDEMLDSIDWKNDKDEDIVLPYLTKLKKTGSPPTMIVFFSKPEKNMIIVEIMKMKGKNSLNHYYQTLFNVTEQYLFIFDNRLKIKKIFIRKNIQYGM